MMDIYEFKNHANKFIDWIIDYYQNIEKYPVKSKVEPRQVYNKLPKHAPESGENIDILLKDFENTILPGITHWQNPNFFAYFPANSSFPSILAELLTSALGTQCMKWETSPAAAELEELVLNWLKKLIGIPSSFPGVIQDTASTATLCAILSAREKFSNFTINKEGYSTQRFRVYCSGEAHSSVEKAVRIAGIGSNNLVKIDVDDEFAMIPGKLEDAIVQDIKTGFTPLCVIAALGTTGSTAVDPLDKISKISVKYSTWLHVDAAFAGSALILPEYRRMIEGIENVDSFVFNPHKWLFTNFDCSAYFVKDKQALLNTFQLVPEYLKTKTQGMVNDYCDWGIQLGRRFRALKLWFVIRNFGIKGLQDKLKEHIALAQYFANEIVKSGKFEVLAPVKFNLVCFRFVPKGIKNTEKLNKLNETLLALINKTGKIYMSHTKLKNIYTLRMVIGQTYVKKKHVLNALNIIHKESTELENRRTQLM